MPIRVHCEKCGTTIDAPDKYGGKRVKCPKCSTPVLIPGESTTPVRAVDQATAVQRATPGRFSERTDSALQSDSRERTGLSLWLLATVSALFLGSGIAGGYYIGCYPVAELRSNTHQQVEQIASLEGDLEKSHGRVAALAKEAERVAELTRQLQAIDAERADIDEQWIQKCLKQIQHERKLAVAEYIEKWRNSEFTIALGMLNDQEEAAVRHHIEKVERGELLSGSEYLWLTQLIHEKVGQHVLPYETVLKVDWSDIPDIREGLDKLGTDVGVESDEDFAKRYVAATDDEERLLLVYEREASKFFE